MNEPTIEVKGDLAEGADLPKPTTVPPREETRPLADRLAFDIQPNQWRGMAPRRPLRQTQAGVERTRAMNPDVQEKPSLSRTGVAPGSELAAVVGHPGVTRRHRRALVVAITSIGKPRHPRLKRRAFRMFAELGIILR